VSDSVEDFSGDASSSLADLNRETADLPPTARTLGGRYRIVRLLGTGGMGSVYEVTTEDGTRLAAKVIAKHTLERASASDKKKSTPLKRFFREARAAQSIENPHVTRTLELGLDDGLGAPFIVMELLDGTDLRTVIEKHAPLASEVVARIGTQAAEGLSAAHAAGIVHRDVKPSNIFLARSEGRLSVKVCDFGIAKELDDSNDETSHELTHSGGILGSPRYMSPEQAKSARRVDARSDVWSLCAALYEAASGRELWGDHTSLGEVIVAICTEPIVPLEQAAPWVDAGLARTVLRGLERDPDARWQNMEVLRAALSRSTRGTAELFEDDIRRVTDQALAKAPRSPRRLGLIVAVLATVGLGVGFAVTRKSGEAPPPLAPPPVAQASPTLLVPSGASVKVNGAPREVVDGKVQLDGQPGEWFDVRVTLGSASIDRRVYVTRAGVLDPPALDLAAEVTPVVAPASSVTPARPRAPSTPPSKVPPPPASVTPKAAASFPVAPTPGPAGVTPKEDW
jgi:serine/threonine-protein kinase